MDLCKDVAPLVGAWIEIYMMWEKDGKDVVAPLVGAWIEIHHPHKPDHQLRSLPLWERGLKYTIPLHLSPYKNVAPLVGAWIEITG